MSKIKKSYFQHFLKKTFTWNFGIFSWVWGSFSSNMLICFPDDKTMMPGLAFYATGDDGPHGDILLLLCLNICTYVCIPLKTN